ncbi:unnamed protein product [Arctia plantaginis]|uniref:Uncharacterized protein n=1 Tax=Arctia plantaginis TaxID=874455 RepID=A0A8S0YLK6_ARCPL|nr:unnamed protein product [Arctia plantaginis]
MINLPHQLKDLLVGQRHDCQITCISNSRKRTMESKVVLQQKNPYDTANILSKIFLTWSFSLFRRGYKHNITLADLWTPRNSDDSGRLGNRLEESWKIELENKRKHGSKPSLAKALVRSFWFEYMLCGLIVSLLFIIVWPVIPYTLSRFIECFSLDKTKETYRRAHTYNFLMNLLSFTSCILLTHAQLSQGRVGMKLRIACCSLMYRKILKLNQAGLGKTEPGQVVNLMSNDVTRFDLVTIYLNYVWVMPIVVPVVTYLAWEHIGVATLAALLVAILQSILVQVYLSRIQGTFRGKIAKRTDERVKVMGELVNGIQVIKMYTWEMPFGKLVNKLRKLEVSYILKTSMVKGFTTALGVFTERFLLFAAIVTFVFMGGDIRAQTTFALAQYFNLLQLACNILIPLGLAFLAETMVSIKRIENFLLLDENNETIKSLKSDVDESKALLAKFEDEEIIPENPKPVGLSMVNISASWSGYSVVDTLRNITLTAKPGEFIGVAGPVGSGKSSLLQLIMGELKPKQGTFSLDDCSMSYASQEPWLFAATIRENILFGQPYDRVRYKKVVKACALLKDFVLLPHGDSTLVGERGATLSGGQRARIGLARACYRQADIYLLDDPLSAVDTHVGKHLVSECVQGLLDSHTRILVTHQLHHLKNADKVLILRHGELEIQGTFEEVLTTPLFAELLQNGKNADNAAADDTLFLQTLAAKQDGSKELTEQGKELNDQRIESSEVQKETEEMSGTGRVPLSVYLKYFSVGSGRFFLGSMVISIIMAQGITSFGDLWLSQWMNDVEAQRGGKLGFYSEVTNSSETNVTESPETSTLMSINSTLATNLTSDAISVIKAKINHMNYIYIWAVAIFGCIVLTSARSLLFLWTCMRSSIKLHNQMFSNILSATMRFFDTNPSGRILNRLSKDMGIIDEILPNMYMESIQIVMVTLGVTVMVAIVNPLMLVTTGVSAVIMYFWTSMYLITAQGIKRVEAVTRSPVFSHVTATMTGLVTVRAFDAQNMLIKQFDEKQDIHTAAWYLTLVTNNAYAAWLSLVCVFYVMVISYTFLLLDDGTTKSGNVGLAISQGLTLANMIQHGVKMATDTISQMTSVERIIQFTSLPQEKDEGSSPPKDWPQRGRIVFKDLSLRYDEKADPVLKNLNFKIESGWKVGIVGRTGAGKSSLISALFRLAPIEGAIYIDEIDTRKLSLKALRSKISIIPQDPILFSASLRHNMDPFEKYSDADIWKVLDQVELKNSIVSLSAPVTAGGSNFSAGERQLLCLARAALAHNKLLVLDEATANVDPATDILIQKSIRKHFADCTVITIAHRLHTVADSDRVIVMEAGQVIECGHPYELLQMEGSHFRNMVQDLGSASEYDLRNLASTREKMISPDQA